MSSNDLISEREAVLFAGVSGATLRRFAETGYLNIETTPAGEQLFSRSEIGRLFGLEAVEPERQSSDADGVTTQPDAPPEYHQQEEEGYSPDHHQNPEAAEAAHNSPGGRRPILSHARIKHLEREVRRLRNLQNLQERLLELREGELSDLKNERDWLKRRIERLEEKSDREQLILLAETQTIRSLIASRGEKRSPLRYALEWLGFTAPAEHVSQTIDVTRSTREQREHDNVYRMSSNG